MGAVDLVGVSVEAEKIVDRGENLLMGMNELVNKDLPIFGVFHLLVQIEMQVILQLFCAVVVELKSLN